MANYQSLKTAINAVIKANGNKEITGTVLNEVLLAMVNSLGAGYQFAGVATPSTNPGTPDQKVFYIASQAGTYTNFNGAVVSDGIAIFEWNGTWTTETLDLSMAGQVQSDWTETDTTKKSYIKHKPNIPEEQVQSDWTETDTAKKSYIKHKPNIPPSANVDPVPTNGSPNAVASGGVYNAIKAITDFLNNGYYFVGIAGTSTEPDSVTQYGIFYIASDGGTYTNFLNGDDEPLTLYQGLNILYKDVEDDGWNYFEVFKFSDFVDTTQQQSLSSQQKAQARTNIAAVSYEQQSLNAGQQVQAQNNMMGKAYSSVAADHSGLGKVYLDKNNGVLTQAMMQAANTVYVIQYDYTVHGGIETKSASFTELNISNLNTPEKDSYDSAIASGIQARIDRATAEFDIIDRQEKYYYVEIQLQAQHALHLTGRAIRLNTNKNAEIPTNNGIIYANEDMTVYVGCLAGNYSYKYDRFITLPSGCTLQFDGGSISGGTLVGNHTKIVADKRAIFTGISIDGTWNVSSVYSNWFSDAANDNVLKDVMRLCDSNMSNHVYIDTGTYNVSAGKNYGSVLPIKSNTIVHNLGTIQLASNYFSNYYIFNIDNVSNVIFEGGNIIGDRDTHTGTTGEWGMGINIGNAHDVAIRNVNVTKCWGDGIYIGGTGTTYNISIDGFTIDDCRRQGISITEVDNATINNGKISKIDGTDPMACIDIEPNTNDVCQNITISNCDFSNQDEIGLLVYGAKGTVRNINVKNCKIHAKKDIEIYYCENISFENIVNTKHLKLENARNIVFSSCHLYLSALITNSAEGVKFTSCDVELVDSNITLSQVLSFESCNIDAKSYVLDANCTFANCSIKSDNDIRLTKSISKNLTIISTKGQKVNTYPIRLVDSQVSYLKLIVKDSEATGSYYAYVYSEDSVVGAINIDSEIQIHTLVYSGSNTLLENVSFVQAARRTYIIDGAAVVAPYKCNKVGSSAARPQLPVGVYTGTIGFNYFDKTLKKPLWWTGDTSDGKSGWVDATGANVPNPQS